MSNHNNMSNGDLLTKLHSIKGHLQINSIDEASLAALDQVISMVQDELFSRDNSEDRKSAVGAYMDLETRMYSSGKPIETKSAIIWGALVILKDTGAIDWDTMRQLYGEFMSKEMKLR